MRRANGRPHGRDALFFLLGPFLQDMDALVRLPDLVGVLVIVQIQKFSISVEGG
jgi:hypothetical protein